MPAVFLRLLCLALLSASALAETPPRSLAYVLQAGPLGRRPA